MRHGLAAATSSGPTNDNRPKRRDRIGGYESAESRVNNHLADSTPPEKENSFVPNFGNRKPSAEFFRARQSDSDPLSLGELRPNPIEVRTKQTETNPTNELKTNPTNELKTNLKDELKTNLKNELETNLKNELETNLKNEIEMNRKKELERNRAEIAKEVARPRRIEVGKKTIFDELKNLEDGVFGEEVKFNNFNFFFFFKLKN